MRKRKLTRKGNLKIAAATSLIMFSLLACFSGAYAWFVANTNVNNSSSNFQVDRLNTTVQGITFHEYYGTTIETDGKTYYSFNPTPSGSVTFSGETPSETGAGIDLGEFSLENPNHPLLMMFNVSGFRQRIDFKTDYSFVAEDNNYSLKATVATFAALEAYNKNTLSDGDYLKVTTDEDHGSVSTIYEYKSATKSYDMVWIDLNSGINPLSSVVQFHSFEFTGTIQSNTHTYDVIEINQQGNPVTVEDVAGITIDTDAFTSTNKSQFVNFSNDDSYTFNKEVCVYEGTVSNYTYVGIVINYNSSAIEYICSKYLGNLILNDGLNFKCDWVTRV